MDDVDAKSAIEQFNAAIREFSIQIEAILRPFIENIAHIVIAIRRLILLRTLLRYHVPETIALWISNHCPVRWLPELDEVYKA